MSNTTRVCANPDCSETVVGRVDKQFHSRACGLRLRKLRYATKPDSPRRDRLSCPECGDKYLRYNLKQHVRDCDGWGKVCRFNHDHVFSSYSNRKSHERACRDAGGRQCGDCAEWKSWDQYHRNSALASGFNTYCSDCIAKRAVPYRAANNERRTEYSRLHRRQARSLEYVCARAGCDVSWSRIKSGKSPKFCQWHNPRVRFNSDSVRRQKLADRDGWFCGACGMALDTDTASEDHCFPKSLMGVYDSDDSLLWLTGLWNLELMCLSCNSSKNDRVWPEQARRALERFPASGDRSLLLGVLATAEKWEPLAA